MTREQIEQKLAALRVQASNARGLGASAAMYRITAEREELQRLLEKA